MRISKKQLLTIIQEALILEQPEEVSAIETYISEELLPNAKDELPKVDIVEQGEGAGYKSEDIEEAIEALTEKGIIEVGDDEVLVKL